MKRSFLLFAIVVLGLSPCSSALGHGFQIFLQGNKIMAESEDFTNIDEHLYNGNFGFDFFDLTGALNLPGGGIEIPADTFSMEIFSPAWYSDGGPAMPIPANLTLTIESYADYVAPDHITLLDSAFWTSVGTGSRTMPLAGHNSDTMIWSLSGDEILPGVYGMAVRIHGLDDGNPSTPFQSSDRLVITFRTPGFGNSNSAALFGARLAILEAGTQAPGDFDSDEDVDGADFVAWQTNFPTASGADRSRGDADADGDVDGADFVVWQTNFPTSPSPGGMPTPEPACASLALIAAVVFGGAKVLKRTKGARLSRL